MMNEESATSTLKRNVNIESAIDKSSFQLPVFVAISSAGGEAQVVKTFATAREVFDHVFSILLDRLRQCRAVEAVECLVPQSAHLTTSRDTEYVLLVRGKAIFWFSGAAAKRVAARRLLLEHARDLAEAERAPFYVLNSRAKKVRAAIIVTGLIIVISVDLLLKPLAVHWTRAVTRHQTVSTFQRDDSVYTRSDQQTSLTRSDTHADYTGADRSVDLSPTAHIAGRHGSPSSDSHPKGVEPEDETTISKYAKRMASFVRSLPDQFYDRLLFAYSYFDDAPKATKSLLERPGIPKQSSSASVAERPGSVSKPAMADQAPDPDKPKK